MQPVDPEFEQSVMDGFYILVDGTPRTYRDDVTIALCAARHLKARNLQSEITIINNKTGEWTIVANIVSEFVDWKPAASLTVRTN